MKRTWAIALVVLIACGLLGARKDETLDELKARAEAARLEDRPPLYTQMAHLQLEAADKLYSEGRVDEARAAVDDVVRYSDQARDAAMKTGKQLKHVEISLRKMAERLRDIRRTLAFEDQPPVQTASDRLETMRTELLAHMFGKEKH